VPPTFDIVSCSLLLGICIPGSRFILTISEGVVFILMQERIRRRYSSEGRAKKDFIGAFLLCTFLVCREKKPAKVAGRRKGIYIYIFSPTLPLA
jgi:hypothetical protein